MIESAARSEGRKLVAPSANSTMMSARTEAEATRRTTLSLVTPRYVAMRSRMSSWSSLEKSLTSPWNVTFK